MMRNKKQVLRIAATLHVLSAKQVLLSSYIVLSTCTQVHQSGNFLLCFEVLHNQTIASIVHHGTYLLKVQPVLVGGRQRHPRYTSVAATRPGEETFECTLFERKPLSSFSQMWLEGSRKQAVQLPGRSVFTCKIVKRACMSSSDNKSKTQQS